MKNFLGFLGDIFVILVEIGICAGVVFYLISNPIIQPEIVYISESRTPDLTGSAGSAGSAGFVDSADSPEYTLHSLTSQTTALYIPPVIWIPEHFAPEKQWGYDRVYSCASLERIPGFWHILGSQPPTFPYFPVYIFDECALLYF